jgi:hypothetical protein
VTAGGWRTNAEPCFAGGYAGQASNVEVRIQHSTANKGVG